jgi:hypothetical protein
VSNVSRETNLRVALNQPALLAEARAAFPSQPLPLIYQEVCVAGAVARIAVSVVGRGQDKLGVLLPNGRIPWPVVTRPGPGWGTYVLYRDLVKAVECEAGIAVAHWWGVRGDTEPLA